MTPTRSALVHAIARIADAIVEAVEAAGADGAPESMVYLALEQHGGTVEQHNQFIDALVAVGRLRRTNHRLFAATAK